MAYLNILRQLVDQQQFELLKANAEACLSETGELAALPLLALACAHLGDRVGAEGALARLDGELGARLDLDAARARHAEAEQAVREGLKHYPENFPLIGQLAELLQIQGRSLQAVQVLRRAVRMARRKDEPAARQIGLWVRLSGASLHGGDGQARQAAEEAVKLAEALAQVESDEQHFERAETLFNDVLADNPWFLPALQGLGHQQMQRGRIDAAIALFELPHPRRLDGLAIRVGTTLPLTIANLTPATSDGPF